MVSLEVGSHFPNPPYYCQALFLGGGVVSFGWIECSAGVGDDMLRPGRLPG